MNSSQFLYFNSPRLIREYWNELNGRLTGEEGEVVEMNLLNLGRSGKDITDITRKHISELNKEDLLSNQRYYFSCFYFQ